VFRPETDFDFYCIEAWSTCFNNTLAGNTVVIDLWTYFKWKTKQTSGRLAGLAKFVLGADDDDDDDDINLRPRDLPKGIGTC
jgi:hypothetical protein